MTAKLFGTNGVRGVVNEGLTADMAMQLGKAVGLFIKGAVAIGTDARSSKDMICSAVSAGLMSVGVYVIDLGLVPTPAMQLFVKTHNDIMGGVMITASHNPPEFNGIKCVDSSGMELDRSDEETIEKIYETEITCNSWNNVGEIIKYDMASDDYVNAIISHVNAEAIRNAKFTVVLDCANGASYKSSPMLLEKLGVRAITLNANPQGDFPGHPSEPTEENLKDLISLVKTSKSDLGIAHDGDADRVVFIADGGSFVSGDKSMALMAISALKENKGKIVTPISSSSMIEEVVKANGGDIVYTSVGSPVVAATMVKTKAVFGGEENGGLLFPEHQYCRDGAMTVAKILESIALNGPLSMQVRELPVYYSHKHKIACPPETRKPLMKFLKETYSDTKIDTTDGLKMFFADGWVLARPSGTEPIFRIYSESKDDNVASVRAAEIESQALGFIERNNPK